MNREEVKHEFGYKAAECPEEEGGINDDNNDFDNLLKQAMKKLKRWRNAHVVSGALDTHSDLLEMPTVNNISPSTKNGTNTPGKEDHHGDRRSLNP